MRKGLIYEAATACVRLGSLSWMVLFAGTLGLAAIRLMSSPNDVFMTLAASIASIGGAGFLLALVSLLVLGPPANAKGMAESVQV